VAIETSVLIRQVFHRPLRQTEGFMISLALILKADIGIPDFSCISKHRIELPRHVLSKAMEPGSLVMVDSTGLKVYGKDEWHQEKHDVPARRSWRKRPLAIDEKHKVLACELTTPDVGDPTAVPDLLDQIVMPFMSDGAYDGEPVLQAVLDKQPDAQVVIPPHKATGLFRERRLTARSAYSNDCAGRAHRVATQNGLQPAQSCRVGDATLQAHFRQPHASACPATAKTRGKDQCVCSQRNDQSGHAGLRENLKMAKNGDAFDIL
jgi:transposase